MAITVEQAKEVDRMAGRVLAEAQLAEEVAQKNPTSETIKTAYGEKTFAVTQADKDAVQERPDAALQELKDYIDPLLSK